MAGDGREEVVAVEREEVGVARRADRRGARHVPQERNLAEVRALALAPRWASVDEDLDLAPVDDVEAVTVVAAADQLVAGGGVHGRQVRRELLEHRRGGGRGERGRPAPL